MDDSEADHEEGHCPVCDEFSDVENMQSQGLVFSGMKALFESDDDTIKSVYSVLTPYDGHTAIGVAAALLHDMAVMMGGDPLQFIATYQQGLNRAQASD